MKKNGRSINKQQSGFTLIEIMVVVIIIGVLAALIAPNVINKAGEARVTAAQADIKSIASALDMYKLDNFTYPTTDQGLQALVSKPSGQPEPKNYNKDGYLPEFPKDPWGNDYIYISPGSSGPYDLLSYGADGREGGSDENQDISK